jgi:hypothetical protein
MVEKMSTRIFGYEMSGTPLGLGKNFRYFNARFVNDA